MSSNVAVDFVLNLIQERHGRVVATCNNLLEMMGGHDASGKDEHANAVIVALRDLSSMLHQAAIPPWIARLDGALAKFLSREITPGVFLLQFIKLKAAVDGHQWNFLSPDSATPVFDFDAIFEQYKIEGRIGELFDEVISALERMHAGGHIDSRSTLEALERVIATLKRGKTGSYFALDGAWRFFMNFMENYLWAQLESIPVIAPAVKALRATILTTNESLHKVRHDVKLAIQTEAEKEAAAFRERSGLTVITYSGKLHTQLGNFLNEKA